MSRYRCLPAAALAVATLLSAAPAHADEAFWGGWYKITFHTDQKSGTSIAAGQQEMPYTASYKITTDCSSGTCVASVLDGPTPKDNVAQTTTFQWTGSQWTRSNSWRWDCTLPDGTITYDPANSVTTYAPQSDGSLAGTFTTTIDSGACQGTVTIPVTATPA
ncbi:Rv2253 family sensor-like surface protein [Mycolicibacterium sp. CBM1]